MPSHFLCLPLPWFIYTSPGLFTFTLVHLYWPLPGSFTFPGSFILLITHGSFILSPPPVHLLFSPPPFIYISHGSFTLSPRVPWFIYIYPFVVSLHLPLASFTALQYPSVLFPFTFTPKVQASVSVWMHEWKYIWHTENISTQKPCVFTAPDTHVFAYTMPAHQLWWPTTAGYELTGFSVHMRWPAGNRTLPVFHSVTWLVGCCFTSTETVGLSWGTGTLDGHLDFHTAPALSVT